MLEYYDNIDFKLEFSVLKKVNRQIYVIFMFSKHLINDKKDSKWETSFDSIGKAILTFPISIEIIMLSQTVFAYFHER